jgi:hypothetical protein
MSDKLEVDIVAGPISAQLKTKTTDSHLKDVVKMIA